MPARGRCPAAGTASSLPAWTGSTNRRYAPYGSGYSLSLIIPALYPFYLPALEAEFGQDGSVMALVALSGALLGLGAALGPRLAPRDLGGDLDEVAAGAVRAEAVRTEGGE